MSFICPICGVKEEVIGGAQPRCIVCGQSLVRAGSYAGLLMSPNVAILRFETILRRRGFSRATTGAFKQEREAWITAVWALGLREVTGKEYWIEVETKEATPDCKVHHIDQSAGYNRVVTHNIEVVEWDEHRSDLVDVIAQKCRRAYPDYFVLAVLGRNGEHIEILSTSDRIKELKIPFGEIWILGRESQFSSAYKMFMLYPTPKLIEFDLFELCSKNAGQIEFMQRQKRSRSTETKDLGVTYLPIP